MGGFNKGGMGGGMNQNFAQDTMVRAAPREDAACTVCFCFSPTWTSWCNANVRDLKEKTRAFQLRTGNDPLNT